MIENDRRLCKSLVDEVREGIFPEPKHCFTISDQQYEDLLAMLE